MLTGGQNAMKEQRLIIVGGGFGGLTVARELRNAPLQITLIDRSNHHLFQPLLYQVATAALSPAHIATPIRSILSEQKNTTIMMAEVTGVDLKSRLVLSRDQTIPYDQLVIATGSRYHFFGHDEWKPFAQGLKTIVDATSIRRKVLLAFEKAEIEPDPVQKQNLLTFVLVGGGPTGVEMAGSIAELAHHVLTSDFRKIDPQMPRIILIEAGKRILATFPEDLALRATKRLQALGVEIQTRTRVESISSKGVQWGNTQIAAHTVIWAAGVIASPAGEWLGKTVDRTGRVKVSEHLTLPGHPEVYVIGDTACFLQDHQALPGVAPVALQQGAYVAKSIISKLKGKTQKRPFRYRNKGNLATVGRSFAIVDLGRIRLAGFFAWVTWLLVHIYYLIGFKNRILVLIEWAWAYFTFQRGTRLILEGEHSSNASTPRPSKKPERN